MFQKDMTNRVHLIDEVRGFSILCMVVYHAAYDLTALFGVPVPLFSSPIMQQFLQPLFAGLFIFISGTAANYSHANLKRGALCFALGMVLTLGTLIFMPSQFIAFGILHCLGVCMMLAPLFLRLAGKIKPAVLIPVSLLLFFLLYSVPQGEIGLFGATISLPRALYQTPFLFWLGFPDSSFFSSDYFSLLPWVFAFLAGVSFGTVVKAGRCPAFFYKRHCRPLAFIGRHTMIIYLLHQPVVYGIFSLLALLLAQS